MSTTTKSRWRRPAGAILVLLLALACAAPPSDAREPDKRERRRVASIREVDLPTTHLKLAEGCVVAEGPRMIRDSFPYLVGRRGDGETFMLTPANLGGYLAQSPQEGGHAPAAIRTGEAAIEAVRLFVPGALVTSGEKADRIVAAARKCAAGFKHMKPKITEYRPKSYAVTAKGLPQDRSMHPVEIFEVSLVALEMDHHMALVHITARVRANGEIEMDRKLIVDGPMLSWQSATIGEPSPEFQRQQKEMYGEAALARKRYTQALAPARDLFTCWAAGRIAWQRDRLMEWFGESDQAGGAQFPLVYALPDGTAVWYVFEKDRLIQARHVGAEDHPPTFHRIRMNR